VPELGVAVAVAVGVDVAPGAEVGELPPGAVVAPPPGFVRGTGVPMVLPPPHPVRPADAIRSAARALRDDKKRTMLDYLPAVTSGISARRKIAMSAGKGGNQFDGRPFEVDRSPTYRRPLAATLSS